jgi:RNA polymerase sigma-70 factor (ECF subfamily)
MATPTADDEARAARLAELERTIRDLAEAGDVSRAATRAVEGYGAELLGYLFALARTPDAAEELFSELCEKLWRALPAFRWESSFRTWAYAIARNLVRESYRQSERHGRQVGLSSAPEVAEQVQAVRTTTVAYMKTETKRRLEMLREALDEDDRTLLVLRVDRKMAWRDIARVMAEGNDDGGDLDRLAAALRKRFERVKERLRTKLAPEPS